MGITVTNFFGFCINFEYEGNLLSLEEKTKKKASLAFNECITCRLGLKYASFSH